MSRPLYISQPLLPSISSLEPYLNEIWQSKIVTNGGPLHNELENQLRDYLNVPNAMLFNNGTTGLLVALKMFDLPAGSEVITTPLTFAATAHAITWNGLKPVFVDVDSETLTIDPLAVEKAITKNTSAILAVHIYGNICDIDALGSIAKNNNIKLIYDSAHAFGAIVKGSPIGGFGDANVFSFHATKLYNTIEGGLITTPNENDKKIIYNLRNFGIVNENEVHTIGINGKMNEIQAAIGLLNLSLIEEEKEKRRNIRAQYCERLSDIKGIRLPFNQKNVINSEQYFPIIIDQAIFGRSRDTIYNSLKEINIFARKYFHPICTDFIPYKDFTIITTRDTPYVNEVKAQILCLPFHSGVNLQDITDICNIINSSK